MALQQFGGFSKAEFFFLTWTSSTLLFYPRPTQCPNLTETLAYCTDLSLEDLRFLAVPPTCRIYMLGLKAPFKSLSVQTHFLPSNVFLKTLCCSVPLCGGWLLVKLFFFKWLKQKQSIETVSLAKGRQRFSVWILGLWYGHFPCNRNHILIWWFVCTGYWNHSEAT